MANRLAAATSAYLHQHAQDPVDWWEWGEPALAEATLQGLPILLSVGYATCHWCHRMARESFRDPDLAALLKGRFVCVKVDREERPDVDAAALDALRRLTGRAGWPITLFLSSDGRPFFGGTYFPSRDEEGLPGLPRVLEAVDRSWRERRDEVLAKADAVTAALDGPAARAERWPSLFTGLAALTDAFDVEHGGFGGPAKFPHAPALELLLRCHTRGLGEAWRIADRTLEGMVGAGLRDPVYGGFHRYATDRAWRWPHFEKTLTDNAQLAAVYLHAWQVGGEQRHRWVAVDTLDYLLEHLRHPGGGFLAGEDAEDAEGEGGFYVWRHDELQAVVGERMAARLGSTPAGNWRDGLNVLQGGAQAAGDEELAAARRALRAARSGRLTPALDDQVITAWNGIAVLALAEAGACLGVERFTAAAAAAAEFILGQVRLGDGQLARSWREGEAGLPAFAEDHALLGRGLLSLYEATFDERWALAAIEQADLLVSRHLGPGGEVAATPPGAAPLVERAASCLDGEIPSAPGAVVELLARTAELTGERTHAGVAERVLARYAGTAIGAPERASSLIAAADVLRQPGPQVVVAGRPGDRPTGDLLEAVRARWLPAAMVGLADPDRPSHPRLGLLRSYGGAPIATACVCQDRACGVPARTPAELAERLDAAEALSRLRLSADGTEVRGGDV